MCTWLVATSKCLTCLRTPSHTTVINTFNTPSVTPAVITFPPLVSSGRSWTTHNTQVRRTGVTGIIGLTLQGNQVTEQMARHTPPPPYTNTSYSSFSPCSSSSASLSPPIAVSSRSEISSSPVKNKYNRRNNPELEKRRTHHCDFLGCTKVYTKSSHLKAHQRIHTGKAGQWAVGTIT